MVVRREKKSVRKSFRRLGLRSRGSGNRGGKGRAGAGKRRHHKPQPHIKKRGFISKRPVERVTLNLGDLNLYDKEAELPNAKVLGSGRLEKKLEVRAAKFSKKAKEAIEGLGGKCVEI